MATKNIEDVYINRDHSFQATLTSGGSAWDISSATEITLTVKKEKSDTTAKITLTKTGGGIAFDSDGSDGVINITLADTDTDGMDEATYKYGITVSLGGKDYEALEGNLTLLDTVGG